MSMIARLVEITSGRLGQLIADPSAVEELLSNESAVGIDEFHRVRDFYATASQRKSAIVNSLE